MAATISLVKVAGSRSARTSFERAERHPRRSIDSFLSGAFNDKLSAASASASVSTSSRTYPPLDCKAESIDAVHKFATTSGRSKALEEFAKSASNRYTRERPSILTIGLSVHTAPVELREKLATPESEWPRAIEQLCSFPHIEEAGVLSTCNRMEVYVVALSWHRGCREVIEWMSQISGIPGDELRKHLFLLRDRDACTHILRVASGLDSLVLGEGQILSQVKQVYTVGEGVSGFGRNLTGLFKQALTAGKRVRSETSICSGAVSVSSAAVELAAMKIPDGDFSRVRASLIGAGKMGKLVVKHLLSKGCNELVVVNRGIERVEALEKEFPEMKITYRPLSDMMAVVESSDLIFTSTSSDVPLFEKEHIAAMQAAPSGMRRFIDIAVPRNVHSNISEVENAVVYNVDDLQEVVAANKEERRRKAMEAESLIHEELATFEAWRDSLETVPTIKRLRAKAEDIRAAELEKALTKLGEKLSPKERKAVEELSKGIVNKLLHGPMACLRSDGSDTRTVQETLMNMQAMERMFDLQPTPLGSSAPDALVRK